MLWGLCALYSEKNQRSLQTLPKATNYFLPLTLHRLVLRAGGKGRNICSGQVPILRQKFYSSLNWHFQKYSSGMNKMQATFYPLTLNLEWSQLNKMVNAIETNSYHPLQKDYGPWSNIASACTRGNVHAAHSLFPLAPLPMRSCNMYGVHKKWSKSLKGCFLLKTYSGLQIFLLVQSTVIAYGSHKPHSSKSFYKIYLSN